MEPFSLTDPGKRYFLTTAPNQWTLRDALIEYKAALGWPIKTLLKTMESDIKMIANQQAKGLETWMDAMLSDVKFYVEAMDSQQQQQQPQREQQPQHDDDSPPPCYVDANASFRPMTRESMAQFRRSYNKMEDALKWKLNCSGRFVEDILFDHGLTLNKENCLHSFILDMDDDTLRGIFSCDEWEEIGDTNIKQDPPLPDNVIRLLYDLNKTDTSAIDDILKDSTRRYEDFNTRTIFYAIDSILLLLDANPNPFMYQQSEQWYQANVWTPLVDKMLGGDLPGVVCVLGEPTSKERKQQKGKLHTGRVDPRSTGMILRKAGYGGPVVEYGAARYDSHLVKGSVHEPELNLSKTLKEMMTGLCDDCDWDATLMKEIQVIGYRHNGTVAEFMVMDNPSGYICRLLRSNYCQVPTTIIEFPKLLLLLATALRMKLRIARSIGSMNNLSMNKLRLVLDSPTMMWARKRKASQCLADTLTTPPPPSSSSSSQKKRRHPYM